MNPHIKTAIEEIDGAFGPDYAKKNPMLVAAMLLQRAVLELANAMDGR
jgi:hypothetical protein